MAVPRLLRASIAILVLSTPSIASDRNECAQAAQFMAKFAKESGDVFAATRSALPGKLATLADRGDLDAAVAAIDFGGGFTGSDAEAMRAWAEATIHALPALKQMADASQIAATALAACAK
ncbi:MAG: hypothetical protein ABI398_08945 [Devosia sp.]